jgi:hypothetical protein
MRFRNKKQLIVAWVILLSGCATNPNGEKPWTHYFFNTLFEATTRVDLDGDGSVKPLPQTPANQAPQQIYSTYDGSQIGYISNDNQVHLYGTGSQVGYIREGQYYEYNSGRQVGYMQNGTIYSYEDGSPIARIGQ